jgi:hypothetical protein
MKNWQHGYELDYLLELEKYYSRYNGYSCSPFSAVKKNTIASGLHENTLKIYERSNERLVMIDSKISRAGSPITMYGNIRLGVKQKGDRTITKMTWVGGKEKLATEILTTFHEPCWLYVWAEDKNANQIAKDAGFSWVGTKVTTFAELYAIYFREALHTNALFDEPRQHPTRMDVEDCSLEKTNLEKNDMDEIIKAVKKIDTEYTNHYSNYNKKNSWGALSLRGYTDDPAFITKPVEMSNKWQLEHIDENFSMQDTELRTKLFQAEKVLELFPGKLHRVRLMKLAPNGGELERHTDQVDPDSGVQNGKVMRFHFPLITNDGVVFTMWGVDGKPKSANMKVGECWYLDTRKPHQAINNGDTDRIHLVVDVEANDEVRGLIK